MKKETARFGKQALAGLGLAAFVQTSPGVAQTSPSSLKPAPVTASKPAKFTSEPDIAFGAYQRGLYSTAMIAAMDRLKANPNDGAAMTLIAELYAQGLSVTKSPSLAARWYKLGAEHGDRQAIFALGLANLKGEGIPADHVQAKALFERAAALNHPGALYNLGVMAIENNGVAPDFVKAADLFKRASDLGDLDAAYALALFYRKGTGVEQDQKHAAELLSKAANENHVPSEIEYAIMLFNGIGVEKDETAAAKLFLKAAAQNNPVAENRAARILAAGRGVEKNMIEAMKWHLLARTAGVKDAWLDSELNKLSPEEKAQVASALKEYIWN